LAANAELEEVGEAKLRTHHNVSSAQQQKYVVLEQCSLVCVWRIEHADNNKRIASPAFSQRHFCRAFWRRLRVGLSADDFGPSTFVPPIGGSVVQR
jgi:hypothetical protein